MSTTVVGHPIRPTVLLFGLLAIVAIAVSSIVLVLTVRAEYDHTQNGVYQLCVIRNEEFTRLAQSTADDIGVQTERIRLEQQDAATPAAVKAGRIVTFRRRIRADRAFLTAPVPKSCTPLKP